MFKAFQAVAKASAGKTAARAQAGATRRFNNVKTSASNTARSGKRKFAEYGKRRMQREGQKAFNKSHRLLNSPPSSSYKSRTFKSKLKSEVKAKNDKLRRKSKAYDELAKKTGIVVTKSKADFNKLKQLDKKKYISDQAASTKVKGEAAVKEMRRIGGETAKRARAAAAAGKKKGVTVINGAKTKAGKGMKALDDRIRETKVFKKAEASVKKVIEDRKRIADIRFLKAKRREFIKRTSPVGKEGRKKIAEHKAAIKDLQREQRTLMSKTERTLRYIQKNPKKVLGGSITAGLAISDALGKLEGPIPDVGKKILKVMDNLD